MKRKAFTLIEIIIAITVFVIFIGFVMGAYLTFHRSQQRISATRSMILEGQGIFDHVSDLMETYTFHYDYYDERDPFQDDFRRGMMATHTLNKQELVLITLDGEDESRIFWEQDEEEEEGLGNLYFEENGGEAVQLNNVNSHISHVNFRIFPDDNPYEEENQIDPSFPHFQPNVQIEMTMNRDIPGIENVIVDLQTSLTSRFYQ